jgi:hypothetical protein
MADATDSKSVVLHGRVGSSPTSGTTKNKGDLFRGRPSFCPESTSTSDPGTRNDTPWEDRRFP